MTYLPPSKYTINDDAYILNLRDEFKKEFDISTDKQEKYYLLWFIHTYQNKLYEYSSNSDNGTWNKGSFLKLEIELPLIEHVETIAELYEGCQQLLDVTQESIEIIQHLRSKNVDTSNISNKGEVPIGYFGQIGHLFG